jgi:DNA-binding response OmpR family regulator
MAETILVIDDDPVVAQGLALRLKFSGFETVTCPDAQSGICAAREASPAAIIVDRQLPDMDGVTVIEWLKADQATRAIPIVMLSGRETDRAAAVDAGATSFLSKPYLAETMLAELRLALQSNRLHAGV